MQDIDAKKSNLFLYAGVFTTSASVLMFEIISTRISRLAFGYNYKFIILSLAVLGIGVGGMISYFLLEKIKKNKKDFLLGVSFFYLLIAPTPFILAHFNPIYDFSWTKISFFFLAFCLYFSAGLLFSFIFTVKSEKVSVIYFWDLFGGAIGIISAVYFLELFGNSGAISVFILLSALSLFFFSYYVGMRSYLILLACAIVILALVFENNEIFGIVCAKHATPEYSYSNSFSQIDAYPVPPALAVIKEPSRSDNKIAASVSAVRMEIDCLATTHLINYDNLSDAAFIQNEIASLPFAFKPNSDDVLIIGSGAGMDIVRALQYQEKNISAVEINPLIIDLYKKYISKNSDVYAEKNVTLTIDDGRRFVETSNKKYDIIVLPSSFKYGKSGLSFYAFIENYLYTEEAFKTYMERLKDGGILALVNRNGTAEEHLNTAISALWSIGIEDISYRVAFLGGSKSSLVLVKKDLFSIDEQNLLFQQAASLGFPWPIFPQKMDIKHDVSKNATKDERPFPAGMEGVSNFPVFIKSLKNNFLLSFLVFLASLLFCIFYGPGTGNNADRKYIMYLSCYFSALGAGFMIFELSLIQRMTVFIGHPTYSLSAVLATTLFFGGLGGLLIERLNPTQTRSNFKKIIVFAILLMVAYTLLLNSLTLSILRLNLLLRILCVVAIVAPPSLLLGTLFPQGINFINLRHQNLIPFMWGLDGLSAVWGGVGGTILYALYGFKASFFACVALYIIVLICATYVWKFEGGD